MPVRGGSVGIKEEVSVQEQARQLGFEHHRLVHVGFRLGKIPTDKRSSEIASALGPRWPFAQLRSDEVIFFPSMAANGKEYFFRRVEVWDEEQQRTLVFLTNHLKFGATTIAAIYKDRWKVELFFKALKQNCKIKTFLGTSANAVHTQIWTALIAMLVLKYLQLKSTFGWSLSNLVA